MGTTRPSVSRTWGHFDRLLAEHQDDRFRQLRQRSLIPDEHRSFEDHERRTHQDTHKLGDDVIEAELWLLNDACSRIVFFQEPRGDRDLAWMTERIGVLRREIEGRRRKGRAA